MTITALGVPFYPWMPLVGGLVTSALGSASNMTCNGAGDKVAFFFQAPSTACPDKAQFSVGVYVTSGDVTVSIEPLSAGLPSGTPVAGSVAVTQTISAVGTKTVTGLAGTAVLTRGTWYALVLTAGGTPNYQIQAIIGTSGGAFATSNWGSKDSVGAWQLFDNTNCGLCCGLFYAGDVPLTTAGHAGAYTTCAFEAYSNATNPDERGTRFQLPVPVRVSGALLLLGYGSAYGAGEDWEVRLYTELFTTPVSQRISSSMDSQRTNYITRHSLWEEGPFDVAANQEFALVAKAVGTGQVFHVRWTYAAALDKLPLTGTLERYAVTRNDLTGAFTPQTTQVYGVVPLISGLDNGAGGSAGGGLKLVGAGGLVA